MNVKNVFVQYAKYVEATHGSFRTKLCGVGVGKSNQNFLGKSHLRVISICFSQEPAVIVGNLDGCSHLFNFRNAIKACFIHACCSHLPFLVNKTSLENFFTVQLVRFLQNYP